MYLTERKIFFSLNHVFSSLTGRREIEDFDWFASYVPAFEVRNGQMWKDANQQAQQLAAKLGKAGVAGSDSHTLSGVARTLRKCLARGRSRNTSQACAPARGSSMDRTAAT